jgi:hypothetical protein
MWCLNKGHGGKLKDQDGDEEDGYDETLVPLDYVEAGQIRDDDLYDILVAPMKKGVFATCIMDCCHSGTVLDLPFTFAADGKQQEMGLAEDNLEKLSSKPNVPTSIILIDARCDNVTVSWPVKKGAVWYTLEYKATVDEDFVLLTDDLTSESPIIQVTMPQVEIPTELRRKFLPNSPANSLPPPTEFIGFYII